ncbi:MAG: hypothetical protein JWO68_3034, partial [Actinomycetia bacterium]|nr:hypothetical protein [Actinomycetes bacterium]
ERYSTLGELKLVLMRFLGDAGSSFIVQVLRDRSVVMLNQARSERDALSFLNDLEVDIDTALA